MIDLTSLGAMLWEWLSFAVRWAHVVVGIGWIGTSFYFVALDLGLRREGPLPRGVGGEEWQVHGGGFYHVQKYMVAPEALPEHLTWFKWESYATWISGFALMVVFYYAQPELYLIDRGIMDLTPAVAIAVSVASLVAGWIAYDAVCRSPFARNDLALMLVLYALLVAAAWAFAQTFSGRAAFLHLGALTGTIMTANVAMVIMPNQRKVVAAMKAGQTPEARLGLEAKQRSMHNNYLTLPVVFLMLSNHNPLAFGSHLSWVIAALVLLMGVTIRHYFNTYHARRGVLVWPWIATLLLLAAIAVISGIPRPASTGTAEHAPGGAALRFSNHASFADVVGTVSARCSMCHATEPAWEGIARPPKGLRLETEDDIATAARAIYLFAGVSHAMPPGNVSGLEDGERALIVRWYEEASSTGG